MEKINKIYGPPGTGKTFRLIRRVKAYQRKGVPLHKIGYFAFTKKAAQEARERIGVSEKNIDEFLAKIEKDQGNVVFLLCRFQITN